jgi:membrane-associated phospholipid phosphatase
VLSAAPAVAQDAPGAWTADHRHAADVLSTSTVFAQIGLDTLASFRAPDRRCALEHQAIRLGVAIAVSELTKHLVSRRRPDGSDTHSFFSEHTALAGASSGWNFSISIPLTVSTGYLRVAANKHYPSDVAVGGAIGEALAILVRCSRKD